MINSSAFQKLLFSLLNLDMGISGSYLLYSISFFMIYNIRFQLWTAESMNTCLILFHSSLVISSLLVLLTVSELQPDLSLLFLSLVISLSSCCYFGWCWVLFLFNNASTLEPISAYISAYSQTLRQWLKQNLLAEISILSPQISLGDLLLTSARVGINL